jgi:trimethylamine--corrinoid protein Co-methyltransferase
MIGKIGALDSNQIETVHSASLQILEKVDMRLRSEQYLEYLGEHGFEIDKVNWTVKMPEGLLADMLSKTPRTFKLYSRDGKRDLEMGERNCYYSTSGCAAYIVDHETGLKRPASLRDISSCAKIVDAVRNLDMLFSPVTAHDVPVGTGIVLEYRSTVENCAKHVHLVDLSSAYEAQYIMRIAGEIVGGADALVKKPIISDMICTVSPLTIDVSALTTVLTFVRQGLPVSSTSMPLAGATAPMTPAGTLALVNAEVIGTMAILQAFHQGAPTVYAALPSMTDPRTGMYRAAAPEAIWMRMAAAQIADRYRIPRMVGGVNSASKAANVQDAYEKAMTAVLSRLVGADMFTGFGLLDSATALALDQLIVDSEICEHVAQSLADRPIDDETLALDLIAKVGPQGHFLAEKHTLKHAAEIWRPALLRSERTSGVDQDTMVASAKRSVHEILKTHQPSPLDASVLKRIDEIVKVAQRNYRPENV